MNLHKNARTTPHSRLLMVRRMLEQKQPATKVAADFGVSERTVRKWLARWRAGGEPALNDRLGLGHQRAHVLGGGIEAEHADHGRDPGAGQLAGLQLGCPAGEAESAAAAQHVHVVVDETGRHFQGAEVEDLDLQPAISTPGSATATKRSPAMTRSRAPSASGASTCPQRTMVT